MAPRRKKKSHEKSIHGILIILMTSMKPKKQLCLKSIIILQSLPLLFQGLWQPLQHKLGSALHQYEVQSLAFHPP